MVQDLYWIFKPYTIHGNIALLHSAHRHQVHLNEGVLKICDIRNIGLEITDHIGQFMFLLARIEALLLADKHL